jgi:glycosyltransferase involved in cell wall biosynthesis
VFVTQNGDWPAYGNNAEFRLFNCEGLVCTNPHFFERNRERYRCALIPNGVDLDRFAPGPAARSRFGLPQGPIVLMVSALIGNKKVAEGIAAVSSVPDATLVVAGDGPLREEIHQLADKLLPGRFLRLTVPSKDMPDLYRSADAFMHLSTDESFGNVFVEAMASGLPIVAYDAPRTRWIIGDDACYPETQHTGDLSAAIVRALQIPVAVESPKRAEEFSWPVIAARYEAFFRELLQ